MENYQIFTETTADLEKNEQFSDVIFIPMSMMCDGKERMYAHEDDAEQIKQIYDEMRAGKLFKTSRISPFVYEQHFAPALKEGDVIYLSFSSGMSPAYRSTCALSRKFSKSGSETKLYSIDSLSATGGMGIMAERLSANKKRGLSAAENVADVENFKKRVDMVAFVEDLTHLKRGGRISATTAIVGSMLNIKPLIRITDEGKLDVFSKCIGEMRAISVLAEIFDKQYNDQGCRVVYICHADNEKAARILEKRISAQNRDLEVKVQLLSPIIGIHLGPGSVVLCYEKKGDAPQGSTAE